MSNARDYQARRGNMRFRRESTGKPEFLHTLNGSGLATSRIFPAMVEQNQLKDGGVKIPGGPSEVHGRHGSHLPQVRRCPWNRKSARRT